LLATRHRLASRWSHRIIQKIKERAEVLLHCVTSDRDTLRRILSLHYSSSPRPPCVTPSSFCNLLTLSNETQ